VNRLLTALLLAAALGVSLPSCAKRETSTTTSTGTTSNQNAMPNGGAAAPPGSSQAEPQLFSSEPAAQAHCPNDQVVWLNLISKIYHEKGSRYYGSTKHGEYACRKEADAAGDRNSRGG